MSKEMTKKLIESGIVEKTVGQLLQRWGSLTQEEYVKITREQVAQETLELFMEEIEILLQPESIERDITNLDQEGKNGLVRKSGM